MDVVPEALGKSGLDLGVFVRGVVVDDQVHVEMFGNVGVDVRREGDELLVPMARLALSEDRAVGYVQDGEQGRRAMSHVVVGHTPST